MLSDAQLEQRLQDVQCALGNIKKSIGRIDVLVDSCNVLLYLPVKKPDVTEGEKQK